MPRPTSTRLLVWAIPALALVAGAGTVTGVIGRGAAAAAELESYGQVPTVALVDQQGLARSTATQPGHVTIVNFIFTRCTTICPVTSMKMERLAARTADAPGIELASISIDPAHDTPPVLAAFAARYHADPARWRFLTGDPTAVRAAVEDGFKLAVEDRGMLADGVPDLVHGGHFLLVDADQTIRGYYDSSDAARLDALVADAHRLDAATTKLHP